MEGTERGKFEQHWQDALTDAETIPNSSVWTGIDAALTQLESNKMKKRVLFYQWLAAASVTIAMLLGGMTLLYWNKIPSNVIALTNNGGQRQNRITGTVDSDEMNTITESDQSIDKNNNDNTVSDPLHIIENSNTAQSKGYNLKTAGTSDTDSYQPQEYAQVENISGTGFVDFSNSNSAKQRSGTRKNINVSELNRARMMEPQTKLKGRLYDVTLYRKLPAFPAVFMNNSRKENKKRENLWAAVNASAGSYSPGGTTSSTPQSVASFASTNTAIAANNSKPTTGSSYGIGMMLGKKVANKVVIFGGVNYLNQASSYGSNIASNSASNTTSALVADYASRAPASLTATTPYNVNSVNEFISVPVQAGYVILERKFGVQLNTGVATDFFVRNTLKDESGNFSSYSQAAGSNSPYRSVNWSGLLGTEMSYKMSNHYRLSLVPGMRYALNSMLKSESGASRNGVAWDVGFRFRYIFQ